MVSLDEYDLWPPVGIAIYFSICSSTVGDLTTATRGAGLMAAHARCTMRPTAKAEVLGDGMPSGLPECRRSPLFLRDSAFARQPGSLDRSLRRRSTSLHYVATPLAIGLRVVRDAPVPAACGGAPAASTRPVLPPPSPRAGGDEAQGVDTLVCRPAAAWLCSRTMPPDAYTNFGILCYLRTGRSGVARRRAPVRSSRRRRGAMAMAW